MVKNKKTKNKNKKEEEKQRLARSLKIYARPAFLSLTAHELAAL